MYIAILYSKTKVFSVGLNEMFIDSKNRSIEKDRSLHAERDAILKCNDTDTRKNMVVLRIKKSGKLTGGTCCENCRNFIRKVDKKINLQRVYQFTT